MNAALTVEWWKVRRSPVTVTATALMAFMLPAMGLGFYRVAQTGGSGPLADKAAAMFTGTGWEGYLGLVSQIAAVAVFLGVGVVVSWAFGREHTDRTFPALFARPVSTRSVAIAKFAVMTAWVAAVAVMICLVALFLGRVAGIGPEGALEYLFVTRLLLVCLGGGLLGLTMGYVASVGRGYLPAIGFLIVVIAVAQVAVLLGTGAWFPYAVPGLLAVVGSAGIPAVTPAQMLGVPIVVIVACWLTVRWWSNAEVI